MARGRSSTTRTTCGRCRPPAASRATATPAPAGVQERPRRAGHPAHTCVLSPRVFVLTHTDPFQKFASWKLIHFSLPAEPHAEVSVHGAVGTERGLSPRRPPLRSPQHPPGTSASSTPPPECRPVAPSTLAVPPPRPPPSRDDLPCTVASISPCSAQLTGSPPLFYGYGENQRKKTILYPPYVSHAVRAACVAFCNACLSINDFALPLV